MIVGADGGPVRQDAGRGLGKDDLTAEFGRYLSMEGNFASRGHLTVPGGIFDGQDWGWEVPQGLNG